MNRTEDQNKFNEDLCEMFLGANIPLKRVNNPFVRKFISTYIQVKTFLINQL